MKVPFKSTLRILCFGAAHALFACSSGNDGGGGGFVAPNISTQPVAITQDNEAVVAQAAFEGTSGGFGLGSGAPGILGAVSVAEGGNIESEFSIYNTLRQLLNNATEKRLQNTGTISVTGIQDSATASCAIQDPETGEVIAGSGSEQFQFNIANFDTQNGQPISFTSGDYVSNTFNNCDYGDGVIQNGTISITFNSNVSLADMDAENFSLDVTFSFNNYSTSSADAIVPDTEVLHGTINLDISVSGSAVDFDMSGTSFYAVSPEESVKLTNFSFSASTDGINSSVRATFTIASTTLDGQITVNSQFASNGADPTAGSMTITGDNSQMVVTVISANSLSVTLTVNGVVEGGYPKDVTWNELGIEVNNAF